MSDAAHNARRAMIENTNPLEPQTLQVVRYYEVQTSEGIVRLTIGTYNQDLSEPAFNPNNFYAAPLFVPEELATDPEFLAGITANYNGSSPFSPISVGFDEGVLQIEFQHPTPPGTLALHIPPAKFMTSTGLPTPGINISIPMV